MKTAVGIVLSATLLVALAGLAVGPVTFYFGLGIDVPDAWRPGILFLFVHPLAAFVVGTAVVFVCICGLFKLIRRSA